MSDLSSIDERMFKVKNRRLWQPGEPYYEISYQVKVIIGAADLRFELCKYNAFRAPAMPEADKCKGSTARSCPKIIRSRSSGRHLGVQCRVRSSSRAIHRWPTSLVSSMEMVAAGVFIDFLGLPISLRQ